VDSLATLMFPILRALGCRVSSSHYGSVQKSRSASRNGEAPDRDGGETRPDPELHTRGRALPSPPVTKRLFPPPAPSSSRSSLRSPSPVAPARLGHADTRSSPYAPSSGVAPTGPCSAFGLRAVCLPPIAGSAACSLVLGRSGLRGLARARLSRDGEGRCGCAMS
jgi:hypothetical protein